MVRSRAGWSRAPPVSRGRRGSSRASRAWGARRLLRAAASSIASGSPSSRRHTSATAPAFAAVRVKAGATAWARVAKRRTAAEVAAWSGDAVAGSGSTSGGTGNWCSPATCRTARLVTSTVSRGQAIISPATVGAAAATCSNLSSRMSMSRRANEAARRSGSDRSPASRTPSAWAIAGSTSAGSASGARSTNQTPSPNSSPRSAATSTARRVLPTPPGPVRVTRGTSCRSSRARTAASSPSRPIRGERGRGSEGATMASRSGNESRRGGSRYGGGVGGAVSRRRDR